MMIFVWMRHAGALAGITLLTLMLSFGVVARAAVGSMASQEATIQFSTPAEAHTRLKEAMVTDAVLLYRGGAVSPYMTDDAIQMPAIHFKEPASSDMAPPMPVETQQWNFWDEPAPDSRGGMAWPMKRFKLSSGFGPRGGRMHQGVDLLAPVGTPIYSAHSGKVVFVGFKQGYGRTVVVRHQDGVKTRYAHMSSSVVRKGQTVFRGQKLGAVGMTGRTTGPHLHFEVLVGNVAHNPKRYLADRPV